MGDRDVKAWLRSGDKPDKISARAIGPGAACFTVRERQTAPRPDPLLLVKKL